MRRGVIKKLDWFGVLGIVLLLVGTPAYLAQDPDTRSLGLWQDFTLPKARIGDHIVFDLVVQESGQDPLRAPAVLEVVHRAPRPGEVAVPSVFVQEVRFFPAHVDLGSLVLHQNGSVVREYYDDARTLVWRDVEELVEPEGQAMARDASQKMSTVSTSVLGDTAHGKVVHEGDPQAITERLILQQSEALFEAIVIPTKIGKVGVRDRLLYEDMVFFGGEPIIPPALNEFWGFQQGPHPCRPADPHTYVGAGGMTYASLEGNPMYHEAVPKEGGGFELGPMRPGPHTIPVGTESVMYDPGRGWVEPDLILPVGDHKLRAGAAEGVGFCQGGTEHLWYRPDVPFPAGYRNERALWPDGNVTVKVDLLAAHVVQGDGLAMPGPREGSPPPAVQIVTEGTFTMGRPQQVPEPAPSETPPSGPRIALSALAEHDRPIAGASLADLDRIVRDATNVSAEVLLGFAYDSGNATADADEWWLLYGALDAPARVMHVVPDESPRVAELPCHESPYGLAMEHHLYASCRAIPAERFVDRPLVAPAWLWERAAEVGPVHSFSYEPLSSGSSTARLAVLFLEGINKDPIPHARGGMARWSSGHVGPDHEGSASTAPRSWGVYDLADGRLLREERYTVDGSSSHVPPLTPAAAEPVQRLEREPIATAALAAGGSVLVLVALLGRLVAALKTVLLYPTVTALYARIEKGKVLAHERREELMRLLEADPGLTPSDVDRRLEWGWGATVHHLETLRRNGKLLRMQVGKSQHYFPPSVPDKATRLRHVVMRTDEVARFLELVEGEPGLSLKELDGRTGLKRPALSKIGSKLAAYGLVTKERDGKLTRFFPTASPAPSPTAQHEAVDPDGVVA